MHNYTHLRFVHSNKRHKRSEYKLGNTGVYEIHMACLYSKFNVQSLCMCVRWNVCHVALPVISCREALAAASCRVVKSYPLERGVGLRNAIPLERHYSTIHFRARH